MTNTLLILGAPHSHSDFNFRGIERKTPPIPNKLDENTPLHQAFLWKTDHPFLTIQDMKEAGYLVRLLSEQNPPEHYELVELTENDSSPLIGNESLGFDLAIDLSQSLLSHGLKYDHVRLEPDTTQSYLAPLLQLVGRFCRPQLNPHGLFDNYSQAEFCLGCLLSLQRFVPNIWDSWGANYRVVGVWRITVT